MKTTLILFSEIENCFQFQKNEFKRNGWRESTIFLRGQDASAGKIDLGFIGGLFSGGRVAS
jgi:hypothetical protein